MVPQNTLHRLIDQTLVCSPVADVGAEDAVTQSFSHSCYVRLQPGLDAGLDVRAHTRPAESVGEDRLHLPALQVSNEGQRQLTMWRSHRDAQDIPTNDVGLTDWTSPAAVGADGRLAILLHQERHAKRPVLGQVGDFLSQGIISCIPLGTTRLR
jgi:hypothetical protein